MSQTTQQNAASSEQLAATALEMSSQSAQLQNTIAFFKLAGGNSGTAARKAPKPANPLVKNRNGSAARSSDAALAKDIALAAVDDAPPEAHFSKF